HRVDHELTWQKNEKFDGYTQLANSVLYSGEAHVRIKLAVIGDEVTEYRESYYRKPDERSEAEEKEGGALWTFVKIPDEWRRKRQENTLGRMVINYGIPIAFGGALIVTALILFLKNLRSEAARTIPWKRLSRWALWSLGAFAIVFLLGDR